MSPSPLFNGGWYHIVPVYICQIFMVTLEHQQFLTLESHRLEFIETIHDVVLLLRINGTGQLGPMTRLAELFPGDQPQYDTVQQSCHEGVVSFPARDEK